jgi:DNA phosphorothioation-associated putative methyltransferase
MSTIGAHKTAMRRLSLSRPVSRALEDGLIAKTRTFFDYGCGRAGDIIRLNDLGIAVSGWDPAYFPEEERIASDVVNLGYVVNVIEHLQERAVVLGAAWALTKKVLIVSARLEHEARHLEGEFQGDGMVTRKRTFQKFFRQEELRLWIDGVLGEQSVAAAPGVFYVFRDPKEAQSFLASRLARREPVPKVHHSEHAFTQHAELLQPFIAFVTNRGRLPRLTELDTLADITKVFGSATAAFSLIRRVTGPERWEQIRQRRRQDVLVYVALAAFGKRPTFGMLEETLRGDIRAFFGTYKRACTEADGLLFQAGNRNAIDRACTRSPIGKLLPDALYVHETAISALPPLLRVYEGCGRQLVGAVDGLTLVKLSRKRAGVSYLVYDKFDRVAHPALRESFIADLPRLDIHHRDFRKSTNPPILHRKELFVTVDHPSRKKFQKLTRQEERAGVLEARFIGRKVDWEEHLQQTGYQCKGHRLIRRAVSHSE